MWKWLKNDENRGALTVLFTVFTGILAAIWAIYNHTLQTDPTSSVNNSTNIDNRTYVFGDQILNKLPKINTNQKLVKVDKSPRLSLAECNKVSHGILRFGESYNFSNIINASKNVNPIFIEDFRTTFSEAYNYNRSKFSPNFEFTDELLEAKGMVYPGETIKWVTTIDGSYPINAVPPTRASNNLVIKYKLVSYEYIKEKWEPVEDDLRCMAYEVSWCGDGYIDTEYNEECDDGQDSENESTCKSCSRV